MGIDALLLPALFFIGMTFGYFFGLRSGSANCVATVATEQPGTAFEVEMLDLVNRKDRECLTKVREREDWDMKGDDEDDDSIKYCEHKLIGESSHLMVVMAMVVM